MQSQKQFTDQIKEIPFPNGNRAQMISVKPEEKGSEILKKLKIDKPKSLIMMAGGASGLDEKLKPHLLTLFSRGISRAAAKTGAMIIDGGTQAGTMAIMGEAVADQGRKSILLGVAPEGKVTYPDSPGQPAAKDNAPLDPNHSHFILVESNEWGGETDIMYGVAQILAEEIPAITILANGGPITKNEILRSIRLGLPIVVIEGSGRLADEIAQLWKKAKKKKKKLVINDPIMSEIIEEGDIHLFSIKCTVNEIERFILQQLKIIKDHSLLQAWKRFAIYDENANIRQKSFKRFQRWILIFGLLATLFALTQTQLVNVGLLTTPSWDSIPPQRPTFLYLLLRYIIIALPIVVSILLAMANQFKFGDKWIILRSSAESIKREIYRYRTQTEIYNNRRPTKISIQGKLIQKLNRISSQLMKTDVNISALKPYKEQIPPEMYGVAAKDDGFSPLSPDHYIHIRLGDQLNYYQLKTDKLEKKLKRLHWLIYSFGGLGTFLAAVGLELWVALTTALVGALTTCLEYQQVENTLMKYNQAATDLNNVKDWWIALPDENKKDQNNIDNLVSHTEQILKCELTGWVQHMEDALTVFKEMQAEKTRIKDDEEEKAVKDDEPEKLK